MSPLFIKLIPFSRLISLEEKLPAVIYPLSLVATSDNILSEPVPPITFVHSTSPIELYFIISPSAEFLTPLLVKFISLPKSIVLDSKYPPAIYPPSLVVTMVVIKSSYSPPITLDHSISSFLLYFIITPLVNPLLFKIFSFSKSILFDEKHPPTTYPPSLVAATELIRSPLFPPIPIAFTIAGLGCSVFEYFIIIGFIEESPFRITSFPKSISFDELNDPPIM